MACCVNAPITTDRTVIIAPSVARFLSKHQYTQYYKSHQERHQDNNDSTYIRGKDSSKEREPHKPLLASS